MKKWYRRWFQVDETNYRDLEWYQQELECARKALNHCKKP